MSEAVNEWGPWIEHDGKGCPCVGMYVRFEIGKSNKDHEKMLDPEDFPWTDPGGINGRQWEGVIESRRSIGGWDWSVDGYFPVIRYRIRRPRALRELIRMVENIKDKEVVG